MEAVEINEPNWLIPEFDINLTPSLISYFTLVKNSDHPQFNENLPTVNWDNEISDLAFPVTGNGITVNQIWQLFLNAIVEKQNPTEDTWKILASQNQYLSKNGEPLTSVEDNLTELQRLWDDFEN